jgi:hypothetical protein
MTPQRLSKRPASRFGSGDIDGYLGPHTEDFAFHVPGHGGRKPTSGTRAHTISVAPRRQGSGTGGNLPLRTRLTAVPNQVSASDDLAVPNS